jgi:LysM repeat protein
MIIVLTGRTMFTSMAKEESSAVPYYKSVQIEDGDSLWKIADRYKEGSRLSTRAYVKELKQINGLKQDTIHAGQYLTVVYFPGE